MGYYVHVPLPYVQSLFATPVPEEWIAQGEVITVVPVHCRSKEYHGVLALLRETLPSAVLISLQRIQNLWLWDKYHHCRERMLLKSPQAATEMQLFHGTRSTSPDQIYHSEYGFDFRLSSSTALWGSGAYFASSARYSNEYAYAIPGTDHRQVILAQVLTGDSCSWPEDRTLTRPPPKPVGNQPAGKVKFTTNFYDSVRGHRSHSDIYVIYEHEKAYPAYIITYIPSV